MIVITLLSILAEKAIVSSSPSVYAMEIILFKSIFVMVESFNSRIGSDAVSVN